MASQVRPIVWLVFSVAVVLTLAALWFVPGGTAGHDSPLAVVAAAEVPPVAAQMSQALPEQLVRQAWLAPSLELFAKPSPPTQARPGLALSVPAVVVSTPLQSLAPAAPTPPPLRHRFLGRFVSPDGESKVWLTSGDAVVEVAKGTTLEGGFVVAEVAPEGIRLTFAPTGSSAWVPIPLPGPETQR